MTILGTMLGSSGPVLADASPADKAAARRAFEAANTLLSDGKFREAAEQYESAYAKVPTAEFAYDAGLAWDKAGERQRAISAYQKFLKTAKPSPQVNITKARLEVLEREQKQLAEAERARAAPPKKVRHQPLPWAEPESKQAFPTYMVVGDTEYVLVGVGLRKKLGFDVYAVGLYVADEPARAAFPQLVKRAGAADGPTLSKSPAAAEFVARARFGRLAVMRFLREVTRDQLQEGYREPLAGMLGSKDPAAKQAADGFIRLFDRNVRVGEEIRILGDGTGKLSVGYGPSELRSATASPAIELAVWNVWLGDKPLSDALKRSMLGRLEVLGQ